MNCERPSKSHGIACAISSNGSGVPNLDDALVNLELRPVHDALRELLEPSLVRMLADLAELPRSATGVEKKQYELQKNAFFELAWNRTYEFLRRARMAYNQRAGHLEGFKPASLDSLASEFRERLRAGMRIPGLESYFRYTMVGRRSSCTAQSKPAVDRDGDVGTRVELVRAGTSC